MTPYMAPIPQKFREIVLQLLFCSDFHPAPDEGLASFMMGEFALSSKSVRLAQERAALVVSRLVEIDQKIGGASSEYSFDRIPNVEKNILRLGVFELFYDETIPPKVAIAESIRLTRKYATPEGGSFVNAILDTLYKEGGDPVAPISQVSTEQAPL